jgi:isomaltose glucohydrolase
VTEDAPGFKRDVGDLVTSSLRLIESQQHASGAFPAGPNYPTYQYCWFRDGAFTADGMSRFGRVASAERFFDWCARVLIDRTDRVQRIASHVARGGKVEESWLLPTRFELDGRDSLTPWANFQVDGYGTWLRVLVDHCVRHRRSIDPYAAAIDVTVDYLCAVGTFPCFDWWEEFPDQVHTATLGAVSAGLRAAVECGALGPERRIAAERKLREVNQLLLAEAARRGHFTKWIGSDHVDGSLLSCLVPFNVVPLHHPIAERTIAAIRASLVRAEGVYRYRGDTFYGGGEWIILTAWLGWCEALQGDLNAARGRLAWIVRNARDGLLPEQITTHAQQPSYIPIWEEKWGPVATPLLWSHAMFLVLAQTCA